MASIGDRLREARTRRGLGFDEAEAATKIRARYLRALEAEQFDLLPGPTFARTFLRTYADFLGLDARLLVEEYRTQHERPDELGEGTFNPVSPRPRERPTLSLPRPGPLVLLGGGLGVLLLFFLVLGLVAGDPGPERPSATAPPQADSGSRTRERRPRRRPRPAPTSVSLLVDPSEATYLCVEDASGQVRYEGTLTGPRRFKGRKLSINLGKRSPRVVVNGKRVPMDRSVAQPIAFEFRPRGRRMLPPGQGPCS